MRIKLLTLLLASTLPMATVACSDDMNTNNGKDDVLVIEEDTGPDADETDMDDTDMEDPDMGVPDMDDTDMDPPDMDDTDMDPPDMDDTDMGDTDVGVDMDEEVDPLLVCAQDCNYSGEDWEIIDCDYDGLTQKDEADLGTDPCENDTDGDGLNDLDEIQEGTDPLVADSDGDGLDDADELYFGFDPNNPSTLNDNVLDGDRWIVHACDEPIQSEPVDYYVSAPGDWQIALPPAFTNYTVLDDGGSGGGSGGVFDVMFHGAVFDDPANEVAGFIMSENGTEIGHTNPVDALLDARSELQGVGNLVQDVTGGEFTTHDQNKAAVGRYLMRLSNAQSVRYLRDEILTEMARDSIENGVIGDLKGFPPSAGSTYTDFRVFISATYREDRRPGQDDRIVYNASIAPAQKFENREKVQFRMDDLTNTTNVSQAQDLHEKQCATFRAGEGNPEADFYWVLDQSGSMSDDYTKVKSVANQFFSELSNTQLDYRLAVTNMDPDYDGKPRANVGWFTDLSTFIAEINEVENGPYSGFEEFGLQVGQDGITWMRSSSAPQSLRIRGSAQLITIWMSDEEANTFQNEDLNQSPHDTNLANFKQFYAANSIAFAIVTYSNSRYDDCEAYRQTAFATGGSAADLEAPDISETIEDIIYAATGLASNYQLPQTPISSTLRVFKNDEWVPRSRENGFDYFAQTNSIAFFGSYRPQPADPAQGRYGDDIAVSYQTFVDTTKNPGMAQF